MYPKAIKDFSEAAVESTKIKDRPFSFSRILGKFLLFTHISFIKLSYITMNNLKSWRIYGGRGAGRKAFHPVTTIEQAFAFLPPTNFRKNILALNLHSAKNS
jgi:hypothetical protein